MSAQEKSASRPEPAREPAPEVQARVQVERPRCPYCHESVVPGSEEARGCGGCLAWQHAACQAEHGACAACGRATGQGAPRVAEVKVHLRMLLFLVGLYTLLGAGAAWLEMWPVVTLLALVGVGSGLTFWRSAMRALEGRSGSATEEQLADGQTIARRLTLAYLAAAALCGTGAALVVTGALPVAHVAGWSAAGSVFALVCLACALIVRRGARRSSAMRAARQQAKP